LPVLSRRKEPYPGTDLSLTGNFTVPDGTLAVKSVTRMENQEETPRKYGADRTAKCARGYAAIQSVLC